MSDPTSSAQLRAAFEAAVIPVPGDAPIPSESIEEPSDKGSLSTEAAALAPGAGSFTMLQMPWHDATRFEDESRPDAGDPTSATPPALELPRGSVEPSSLGVWTGLAAASAIVLTLGVWISRTNSSPVLADRPETSQRQTAPSDSVSESKPPAAPASTQSPSRLPELKSLERPLVATRALVSGRSDGSARADATPENRRTRQPETSAPNMVVERAVFGVIRVRTTSGARVFLDDVDRGFASTDGELLLRGVPAGTHGIRVRLGDQEVALTTRVTEDGETSIDARIAPAPTPLALVVESAGAPANPSGPPPAPRPRSQTFEFSKWPWTVQVSIGPNELRYEKRTSAGRVDGDAFSATCADIPEYKPGAFGGAFQIRLRDGKRVDVDRATKDQMVQVQQALEKACPKR